MNDYNDYSTLDTIRYPFQMCGIFKTPARVTPDNIVYHGDEE